MITTADLAAQSTETLMDELESARHGRRRNVMIDILAGRGAIAAPAFYSELIRDDIITFGSQTTEWVVLDCASRTLLVRQIKGSQLGQITHLTEGDTRVWRVL